MKTNKNKKLSWEKPTLVDLTDDIKTAHAKNCTTGASNLHSTCHTGGMARVNCKVGSMAWV